MSGCGAGEKASKGGSRVTGTHDTNRNGKVSRDVGLATGC